MSDCINIWASAGRGACISINSNQRTPCINIYSGQAEGVVNPCDEWQEDKSYCIIGGAVRYIHVRFNSDLVALIADDGMSITVSESASDPLGVATIGFTDGECGGDIYIDVHSGDYEHTELSGANTVIVDKCDKTVVESDIDNSQVINKETVLSGSRTLYMTVKGGGLITSGSAYLELSGVAELYTDGYSSGLADRRYSIDDTDYSVSGVTRQPNDMYIDMNTKEITLSYNYDVCSGGGSGTSTGDCPSRATASVNCGGTTEEGVTDVTVRDDFGDPIVSVGRLTVDCDDPLYVDTPDPTFIGGGEAGGSATVDLISRTVS